MDWKTRSENGHLEAADTLRLWRQAVCAAFCILLRLNGGSSTASLIECSSSHSCEWQPIYPVWIVGCVTSSWQRRTRSQSRQARIRMSDARLWLAGITFLPVL